MKVQWGKREKDGSGRIGQPVLVGGELVGEVFKHSHRQAEHRRHGAPVVWTPDRYVAMAFGEDCCGNPRHVTILEAKRELRAAAKTVSVEDVQRAVEARERDAAARAALAGKQAEDSRRELQEQVIEADRADAESAAKWDGLRRFAPMSAGDARVLGFRVVRWHSDEGYRHGWLEGEDNGAFVCRFPSADKIGRIVRLLPEDVEIIDDTGAEPADREGAVTKALDAGWDTVDEIAAYTKLKRDVVARTICKMRKAGQINGVAA